jgi:hypothetical protein
MSRFNETNVPAPLGKTIVRGVIVSTKAKDTGFGTAYKMTVKVTTEAGAWLCWGTIPTSLFDEADKKLQNVNGWIEALRGCEVQFTATLEAGSEPHFVFTKRPTKATIVTVPAGKEKIVYDDAPIPGSSAPLGIDPFAEFAAA